MPAPYAAYRASMTRPLFDVYCIVDWSANSTPKRGADSIWIGIAEADGDPVATNMPTRAAALAALRELIDQHVGRRILIGLDFPFGYPVGFAAAAGLTDGPAWLATWQHLAAAIEDDHRNRNNRWAVATDLNRRLGSPRLWGVPPRRASIHLTTTRPPGVADLPLRHTEVVLRSHTGRPPFTNWQLLGAGSVGSQALTGIPVAHALRQHPRVQVWPFDTGLAPATAADAVVLAEVWPSIVKEDGLQPKDRGQVTALARHFRTLDRAGDLVARFRPTLPDDVATAAVQEEGWVLDAPFGIRQDRP